LDFPTVGGGGGPFSSGGPAKKVPYAPHLLLICSGNYLIDTSSWPPTATVSDIGTTNIQLFGPQLSVAKHVVTRRTSAHSTTSEDSFFITDSLPFRLNKKRPATDLLAELNAAAKSPMFNEHSKIPFRGRIGERVLIGEKPKRGNPVPLLIETAPGSLKFALIQGVEQEDPFQPYDPETHKFKFRNDCRIDRCRRINLVKMPTQNAPAGFYEDAIFMLDEVYLVKEGTNEAEKISVFEQDGVSAAPIARTPREGTHFFEYVDEQNGGHRRLFQVRFGELFEILWDASKPLSVRYMRIFTKGFPGTIKTGSVAAGVGLLITKAFNDDGIACALVRVPAPLKSFDAESVAQFSLGASYTTVTWPELGWGESSHSTQIMWSVAHGGILTLGQAPDSAPSGAFGGFGIPTSDEEVIKTDYSCSKCHKWGLKGMAWIPKTSGNDFALCANCYDGLDVDARIATAADLELTDMDALIAKSVIPFVPAPGKSIATKLGAEHLSSKQWSGFSPFGSPPAVRAYVPRTDGPMQLKPLKISTAFSRCGTIMNPPAAPNLLSIVAGWESKPNLLPESHLVSGWKRYDSLRGLMADNLGAIVFVCRQGDSFGGGGLKVTLYCFLDFLEKFSDDPQSLHVESAMDGSYSSSLIKLQNVVWLGVVDYDVAAASNPDRETLVIDSHGFGGF
jgi:hypothetical protein